MRDSGLSDDVSALVRGSARGSLVLMVGQIGSALVSALTVILVARLIGSERYGEYTVTLVPVAIAMLLQDVGITNSMTRFCAMYRGEGREEELRSVILVGLFFTLATSLLVSGSMYFFSGLIASEFMQRPALEPLVRYVSVAVLGSAVMTSVQCVFVGYGYMAIRSGVQILWSISRAIVSIALVFLGFGSAGAVLGYSLAFVMAGLVGFGVLWVKVKPGFRVVNPWGTLKLLLGFGVPLYLATLFSGGLTQIYNTLMTVYVPTDVIGNYGAATNFGVLVSFLTLPIGTALFPSFAKLQRDDSNLRMLYHSAVKYTSMLTTPVVACIVLLAEPLTRLFYGPDYPYVALFLGIYVLTYVFEGLGGVSMTNLINGVGASDVTFRANVITFAVGVPIAYLLVPSYGILGLLTAVLVAPRFGWLYQVFWMRRSLGFTLNWGAAARVYASNLVAFGFGYVVISLLSLKGIVALVVGGVVFVVVYICALPVSGSLGEGDFRLLEGMSTSSGPFSPVLMWVLSLMRRLRRD